MNKENKVTSLKLSKKIHDKAEEKGFELPESECGWYQKYNGVWGVGDMAEVMNNAKMVGETTAPQWEYFKAFDCAELGEMLPESLSNKKQGRFDLKITKSGVDWFIKYANKSGLIFGSQHIMCPKGLAEAMGQMYFYLLDNDLLCVEKEKE